ncbi:MAG: MerR family transcriptional regulator [Nocardioides sp.]|uniref:MerR family transcriptional regulator n=1 Tax=Nocardioides sp. TaxID=35761 RepID=UPI003EFBD1B8
MSHAGEGDAEQTLLTLDELSERSGMSVRNIRFYTTRGLLPSPIRKGRQGFYSADHLARLELVQELQSHGFTLSAIEGYVSNIPAAASPEDIALHRTMLAPWSADMPVEMDRAELCLRTGRELSDADLETLAALGIVREVEGAYRVAVSQLSVGISLLDLGFPPEAAIASARIYGAHGRQIADELYEVFRTMVWPAYKESTSSPERLTEVVERLKPLSIASLVAAYEAAMDEAKREGIAKRAT